MKAVGLYCALLLVADTDRKLTRRNVERKEVEAWMWLNVTGMPLSDEALLAAMRGMFCVRAFHENMMSKMRDVCAIRLRTWIEKPCGHVGLPSKTDEHGENEIRAAAQNNNSHYTGCCTG